MTTKAKPHHTEHHAVEHDEPQTEFLAPGDGGSYERQKDGSLKLLHRTKSGDMSAPAPKHHAHDKE